MVPPNRSSRYGLQRYRLHQRRSVLTPQPGAHSLAQIPLSWRLSACHGHVTSELNQRNRIPGQMRR